MYQYRAEVRCGKSSSFIDVMADNHKQAKYRVERSTNLLVLSTEFIA